MKEERYFNMVLIVDLFLCFIIFGQIIDLIYTSVGEMLRIRWKSAPKNVSNAGKGG